MSGTDTANMVPSRYDVIIDGYGYCFWNGLLQNLPFRYQRATYTYSPTFLERTNVSGAYGDNMQAFWLTASQNDWSGGEARRYFRANDAGVLNRYWTGTNVDPTSVPGQVSIRRTTPTLTFAAAVRALTESPGGVYAASATNLYLIDATGGITDNGAHSLGATPSQWGLASDSVNVFVSTTAAGTVGVRRWNGSAWSLFSATGADSLAFLNNVLYGYQESTGELIQYSSSGSASVVFPWKDATGTALTGATYATRLRPYGGKLLILRKQGSRRPGELWQYDGTSVSELGDFPANFSTQDMEVVSGIVVVSGYLSRNADIVPALFYHIDGRIGLLWQANIRGYTNKTWPALAAYGEGIAFTDDTTGKLMQYNVQSGGVHTLGSFTATNATPMMAANKDILVHSRNSTTGYYFPSTTVASSATVVSSMFDFDNSLLKLPRGVKVEFDTATDGNGGSVDIAYQFDSVDGSYSTLQTGAVSGTEYSLPGTQAHSISVKVTLNKGTSTYGPALKRVFARAVPLLSTYRLDQYVLDLTGNKKDPSSYVPLRDGIKHPLDGATQAINLRATIASQVPVSVTDRFGTFTAVIEPGENVTELDEVRPQEYVAQIKLREV